MRAEREGTGSCHLWRWHTLTSKSRQAFPEQCSPSFNFLPIEAGPNPPSEAASNKCCSSSRVWLSHILSMISQSYPIGQKVRLIACITLQKGHLSRGSPRVQCSFIARPMNVSTLLSQQCLTLESWYVEWHFKHMSCRRNRTFQRVHSHKWNS